MRDDDARAPAAESRSHRRLNMSTVRWQRPGLARQKQMNRIEIFEAATIRIRSMKPRESVVLRAAVEQ